MLIGCYKGFISLDFNTFNEFGPLLKSDLTWTSSSFRQRPLLVSLLHWTYKCRIVTTCNFLVWWISDIPLTWVAFSTLLSVQKTCISLCPNLLERDVFRAILGVDKITHVSGSYGIHHTRETKVGMILHRMVQHRSYTSQWRRRLEEEVFVKSRL